MWTNGSSGSSLTVISLAPEHLISWSFSFQSLLTHLGLLWPWRITAYMPRALCVPMDVSLTLSLRVRKHPCSLSIKNQVSSQPGSKKLSSFPLALPIFLASRSFLHPHFYVRQQLNAYSSQTRFPPSLFYVLLYLTLQSVSCCPLLSSSFNQKELISILISFWERGQEPKAPA